MKTFRDFIQEQNLYISYDSIINEASSHIKKTLKSAVHDDGFDEYDPEFKNKTNLQKNGMKNIIKFNHS